MDIFLGGGGLSRWFGIKVAPMAVPGEVQVLWHKSSLLIHAFNVRI